MPTVTLPDFIRTNVDAIVSRSQALSQGMPSAQQSNRAALQDHAKGILLAIAADLDNPKTTIHSHDCLPPGLSTDQSMLELRALQTSVMQLWSESTPTEPQTARAEETRFNEAIDQALSESLKRSARLFDALLSASPDLNFIMDTGGRFVYANRATIELLRSTAQGLVGKDFIDLGLPRSHDLQQILQGVIDTRVSHHGEISFSPSAEGEAVFDIIFEPILNGDGALDAVAATGRNVTHLKATEEEAMRRANYDFLTGLPNRSYFLNSLGQDIQRAGRSGLSIALLYIDLDGFKKVNDRHGQAAGDQLLQQVTQRISRCVRGTDTVARLGSNEFAVVLTDVSKALHVEILVQEMLGGLTQPFSILSENVQITAHMGITFFPQDASTPDDLLKNAGQAMYVAKSAERSCFSYFKVTMRDAAWARRKVIGELRRVPMKKLSRQRPYCAGATQLLGC
jgi:diguanylate cyclase (GGDEF)-like protein/PAS domain S-box-containing protein